MPEFKKQNKMNVKDNDGMTAIDLAREENFDAIVKLLESSE